MFYVGIRSWGGYEAFQSVAKPTLETHGNIYQAVIGPFDTKRGAAYMELYGRGNPHLQCVADAERLAKLESVA